jgi:diaminopimelate decarboxylase
MSQSLSHTQLVELANQFGTPLYVYHAEKIKEQYETLQNAFKNCNSRFFYACKALTNINILKYIDSLGCGIDCSSINEVKLALHAGISPEKILYTSNGISFKEIEEAVSSGVHVNIDSLSNLEKVRTEIWLQLPGWGEVKAKHPGRWQFENFNRA